MYRNRSRVGHRSHSQALSPAKAAVAALSVALAISLSVFAVLRVGSGSAAERREILRQWEAGNFEQVFLLSSAALSQRPLDYFLLTAHGFSAFQLGSAQINTQDTLTFMDSSVRSLRRALLLRASERDGRVFYVLGKAYSYKGEKFAGLAVQFLQRARDLGFESGDIDEYLGLSYAAIGEHARSVEAFSRALQSSGGGAYRLQLQIALSYMALGDFDRASVFLLRCIENSPDARVQARARLLLAESFMERGEHDYAENLFVSILRETGPSAEVHFRLGEIYNIRGDSARAASEWRLAHAADPAHAGARARLDI